MRVVLSGYYGFGNLGDEALLRALVAALRSRGAEPVVLSGDPADTRRRHGVAATHRIWGLVPALVRADALISGGGGLLQNRTSTRSLTYYLGTIRLAQALGRRVAVFGQSIGPLDDAGRFRVRRTLRGIPVAVRDTASVALLEDLGIEAVRFADAAVALAPEPDAAADPATATGDRTSTRTSGPTSDRTGDFAPPNAASPVLLVPRHGTPTLNEAVRDAAQRLHARGVPLRALAMHGAEDTPAVEALMAALPSGAVARTDARTVDDVLAAVRGSRYVVSVRLHPLVFAAALGRGHAGLVYDPKVQGFLEASGGAIFAEPVDAAALAARAAEAAPMDAARRRALRASAEAGFAWLAATLGLDPVRTSAAAERAPR